MNSAKVLLLANGIACGLLALLLSCDSSTTEPVDEPPPLPSATADQVGLPTDYATTFRPFYVLDRPDNRQVRVVYGNVVADSGAPFRHGSVLVMETWRARLDAQGVPVRNAAGRYERDALVGIFVMRKDKWLGRRYKENQTGDWEYASFLPDRTPSVVGDAGALGCAVCHLDASPSRDWVYRANIRFAGGSGAVPTPPAGQPANQPFIDNYTFLPGTITVTPGTRVTWTNRDQVKHTISATNATFSALLSQGASISATFNTVGTITYFCAIHPTMRGTVVVQP
ncbi:MAG: cytochrome P460 family protein [Longimicrobiales bacterium]